MDASFSRRKLLTPAELRSLTERSDLQGGLQMASHLAAILGVAVLHGQAMGTGWVWVTGAALGYLALLPFPSRDAFQAGTLPLDITQGSYGLAIALTLIGAILASILPARSAARVDPVTAIGQ